MAPRRLSMSNVADSDVLLGSVSWFPYYLPANGPTDRPFGTTPQAVNSSGLHSVKIVPFFSSDLVSASIPPTWATCASLRTVTAPFVFSKADCYWYTVGTYPFSSSHGCELHHRVAYLAMKYSSLITTRYGEHYRLILASFE